MGRLRPLRVTPGGPLILADSSAWVEYDRATLSNVDQRMVDLARPDSGLVVTAPVIAEVAMGARSDRRERDLRELLGSFPSLPFGPGDLDAGVTIYRACRRAGITPGGLVDCTIVAIAMAHEAALLTADVNQARIARAVPVRLDPASVTPP